MYDIEREKKILEILDDSLFTDKEKVSNIRNFSLTAGVFENRLSM